MAKKKEKDVTIEVDTKNVDIKVEKKGKKTKVAIDTPKTDITIEKTEEGTTVEVETENTVFQKIVNFVNNLTKK